MSTPTTPRPETAERGTVRTFLADTRTIARRSLIHIPRAPEEPILALVIPVMLLLLFGTVFGEVMAPPTATTYMEFLLPGILVMVMMYGVAGTATGIARDVSREVMDRFRSMPMSAAAILSGRACTDLVRGAVELAVLLLGGLMLGWRWEGGIAAPAAAIGLLLLFRFAMIWVGILLGLLAPGPDAVGLVVYPLAFPLSVLSTTFLAPQSMPDWLVPIAEWSPISAVVEAVRELFGNPTVGGESWAAQHPLFLAVAAPLALVAVCAPLAIYRFRRLTT
ncbi:ABC transporter permease [Lipingzhangella sp. LS1_29]|uniref:Transport permease protein n=1 Tax=Lipingzhangella rawalii TaxID=2055835 RepID=A0ABU2H8N4_9ACTN|nr:ABC transporter permease [Lipingzhangella rawalii]MDS1271661.1 ABC transporter permease [Lipingzhangella rawalii]